MQGPFYAINGTMTPKGPFQQYQHAKQALNIPHDVHNDQILESGTLYRYGSKFIGTAASLAKRNIAYVDGYTDPKTSTRATHYAVVQGREVNGRIQTIHTGPWQKLL